MRVEAFELKLGANPIYGDIAFPEGENIEDNLVIILAHGMNPLGMNVPVIKNVQELLARRGFICARFNFVYTSKGRKTPDDPKLLLAAYSKVADYMWKQKPAVMIFGGYSMGSLVAAHAGLKIPCHGLLALALPLTDNKNKPVNTKMLLKQETPMLFCSGTDDKYSNARDLTILIGELTSKGKQAELFFVDSAHHDFSIPSRSLVPQKYVYVEIVEMIDMWISHHWY